MLDAPAQNRRRGKPKNPLPAMQGSKNHNAILTEQDVLEIRLLGKLGIFDPVDLAPAYGVSPSTVGNVVKKTKWRHVAWYGKAQWRTFPY